jgi:glycerophosphoryl diester phosphodiesterase
MIFHDRTLLRLLGINKELRKFSAVQLQNFRFINQAAPEDVKIPTLSEIFEEFGNLIYYNIEIKSHFGSYVTLMNQLYEIIQSFGLQDRVWISSFDPRVLWQWRRTFSAIPLALLFDKWRLREKWLCRQKFADILHPDISLISKIEEIERYHKRICIWTVNSVEEAEKVKNRNLMGIISDNIPLIKEII